MLLLLKACGRRPVVNARCSGSLRVLPVGASATFDDLSSPSAPAPGMVIQHMCIEPVFIFFICKTSDAPAAASDQKIRKIIKNISVYCSILQYTAVYCSILDAARVPPPYSLYHSPRTQNTRRHPLATKASRLAGWRLVALRSAWEQQLVPGLRPPPADPAW